MNDPAPRPSNITIRRFTAIDADQICALADILVDCVQGGASVGFMLPLTHERAAAFWSKVAKGVHAGERVLLVAEDSAGICGTVQLILDLPENQPHRADLVKMLVHSRARRRGVGAALLAAAEAAAKDVARPLLVLDAVTDGDAARMYERGGWTRVGDVPGFAFFPDGRPCGTTYFFKHVDPQPAAAESINR